MKQEVALRFIPVLMIYLYHQGLFCDRKVKVILRLQEILETVTTDEGKEGKTLRLARGGKDMSILKRTFRDPWRSVYSGNIDERSDGAGRGV